ncbi:MAG: shikimate dehydrogenase [Chloroflexota bacterium]|nr:shikimate dehydrogenase [Dehalococcoidia bacterium]MDW8253238.1 shikimate dehydrogenase [Chloroflexota bacterium]
MSRPPFRNGRWRAAVIGKPIGHSLSPAIQNAAFQASGFPAWYEAIEVDPEDVPALLALVRGPQWLGVNVTIPHKEAVARLIDERSHEAARAGAVNTVVRVGETLVGHNTDIAGFLRALREDARFDPRGCAAVVLGAGGAARACAVALADAGARRIVIVNRDQSRAERLAADLGADRIEAARGEEAADACRAADLLVNATSVGMRGGPAPEALPLPAGWLPRDGLVYDLVYRPTETPLLRAAIASGLPVLGGLAMLVYQGAAAFELWTGIAAPVERMREAAAAKVEEASACSDS